MSESDRLEDVMQHSKQHQSSIILAFIQFAVEYIAFQPDIGRTLAKSPDRYSTGALDLRGTPRSRLFWIRVTAYFDRTLEADIRLAARELTLKGDIQEIERYAAKTGTCPWCALEGLFIQEPL
ncbi:MAG: hypothetical protein ABIG44_14220 [Planctomycetota bacterium]